MKGKRYRRVTEPVPPPDPPAPPVIVRMKEDLGGFPAGAQIEVPAEDAELYLAAGYVEAVA
jgi:hypothetical protein